MHLRFQASAVAGACLLSACGFIPPAPPVPGDLPRITINQTDPRLNVRPVTAAMSVPPTNTVDAPAGPPAAQPEVMPFLPVPPASETQPDKLQNASEQSPAQPQTSPPDETANQTLAGVEPPNGVKTVDVAETAVVEEAPLPIARSWHIGPSDLTVRQALGRWAAEENWTFGPDQWLVPWDIPIEASAVFHGETFEAAVQVLAESIALTETPINTCFYGNRVLRVLPYNQSCNRTASHLPRP